MLLKNWTMPNGRNPKPRKEIKAIKNFSYHVEEYLKLPYVENVADVSFFKILNARKSEKEFSVLEISEISRLLWYSSKVKNVSVINEKLILTHRNSPSAGGIHPIDVFVSSPANMTERVLFYYEPFTHRLAKIKMNQKALAHFFELVNNNINIEQATLIWFGIDLKRTESKYKNPESLIWRDTGALIVIYQLVATALNLKSCPVGTLGNPYFSKLFSKNKIFSGGGLLIG